MEIWCLRRCHATVHISSRDLVQSWLTRLVSSFFLFSFGQQGLCVLLSVGRVTVHSMWLHSSTTSAISKILDSKSNDRANILVYREDVVWVSWNVSAEDYVWHQCSRSISADRILLSMTVSSLSQDVSFVMDISLIHSLKSYYETIMNIWINWAVRKRVYNIH